MHTFARSFFRQESIKVVLLSVTDPIMRLNSFLLLLSFIILLPKSPQAQNADEVINRYLSFIGGTDRWSTIKTLVTSGEYNYGGIKFPFTAYAKAPNRYKFVVPFEGKFYAQGFDGKEGWKIDAFKNETKPTLLTGKAAMRMANEADVEVQDAFINYKEKGHVATLDGKEIIQGRNCMRVKFKRANGDHEIYYFDEETSAIVMKSATSKNAELPNTMLNTMYSDYREVTGIKIPFRSVSTSNDQMILEVTIDKAEINTAIDDREFQPPK
jgi:protein involved in ribonucleotide reduction